MTTRSELSGGDACRRCRKGHVTPVSVDGVYAHEGEQVAFADEFMRCDNCGHEFYTPEQSEAQSRAITAALRKHRGFMTGEEIRAARLWYGLTLPDFEQALGVGRNTVGRWERSTVPPSGAANLGLWLAATHREVFIKWAALRGVEIRRPSPTIVRAELTAPANQNRLTVQRGGQTGAAVRVHTSAPISRFSTVEAGGK